MLEQLILLDINIKYYENKYKNERIYLKKYRYYEIINELYELRDNLLINKKENVK